MGFLFYICNMNLRLEIISFLKERSGQRFSSREIFNHVGGDYKDFYNVLVSLRQEHIVNRIPKGKRNYEYFVD